jgi:hypothetical protein
VNGWGTWSASWIWSLALVAITIAIHVVGIVLVGNTSRRVRKSLLRQGLAFVNNPASTIVLIVLVALSLAVLHAIEAMVWALVYVKLGALPTPAAAALYSVDSITTRGASGLVPHEQWRMMGATEAGDGMLLFGISTAFLFYVMLHLWKDESQSANPTD